jgi:hemerythrin
MVAVDKAWPKELLTGVPMLDQQHEAIFECVNEIARSAQQGRLLLTVHAIGQLKTYVRDHFEAEESLMRIHGYPRLPAHIAEHTKFKNRLFEFIMQNTRRDNTVEMVAFLTDWLSSHVAGLDLDYIPYLTCQMDFGRLEFQN